MSSYLNTVRRVAILTALTALAAGCDKYIAADTSDPALVRAIATDVDLDTTLGPPAAAPIECDSTLVGQNDCAFSATSIAMTAPITDSVIRVYFNHSVDGSSIQQPDAASNGFCVPAASSTISITATDASGASTTGLPTGMTWSVCYDPTMPGITVIPAVQGCSAPEPAKGFYGGVGQWFQHGTTYTIAGTVKDHNNKSLSFSVAVKGADLAVLSADVNTNFTVDSGSIIGFDQTDLSTSPQGVPLGALDSDTGMYDTVTGYDAWDTGLPTFGSPIDIYTTGPQAIDAGSNVLANYTAAGGSESVSLKVAPLTGVTGSDDASPATIVPDTCNFDPYCRAWAGGDNGLMHLYPMYPMEAAQTHTVTVNKANFSDVSATPGSLAADVSYTFTTSDADKNKIVYENPAPVAGAAYYPTLSAAQLGFYMGLQTPSFAASVPLKVDSTTGYPTGTISITPAPHYASGVTPDYQPCDIWYWDVFITGNTVGSICILPDTRQRVFGLGTNAGDSDMVLDNDTDYTVKVSGATNAIDNSTIPDTSWTFHTMKFGMDPNFAGLVSSITSSLPTVLLISKGNVDVVTSGGKPTDYWAILTGKVDANYAGTKTGSANNKLLGAIGEDYFPLTAGTVSLLKTSDGSTVAATAAGAVSPQPYELNWLPDSAVGVTPNEHLDFDTAYQLVVDGVKNTPQGTAADKIVIPFTTAPFQVKCVNRARFSCSGSQYGNLIRSGYTGVDPATSLYVMLTGPVGDPNTVCPSGKADPTYISLLETGAAGAVPVDLNCTITNGYRVKLTPAAALKYEATYTLQVKNTITSDTTSNMAAARNVVPTTLSFTTSPAPAGTSCN